MCGWLYGCRQTGIGYVGGRAGGHKCRKLFHEVGCEGELKEEGQWLEAGLRPRENSLLVKIYLVMFM